MIPLTPALSPLKGEREAQEGARHCPSLDIF